MVNANFMRHIHVRKYHECDIFMYESIMIVQSLYTLWILNVHVCACNSRRAQTTLGASIRIPRLVHYLMASQRAFSRQYSHFIILKDHLHKLLFAIRCRRNTCTCNVHHDCVSVYTLLKYIIKMYYIIKCPHRCVILHRISNTLLSVFHGISHITLLSIN